MSNLKLKYAFNPTPNPIRASAKGANANQITLQVMIDRPGPGAPDVTVEKIEIQIPMGSGLDHVLSAGSNLPSPTYDPNYDCSSQWKITTPTDGGDTVTIQPQPGASGTVGSAIIFYLGDINGLTGIKVNEVPGFVQITITEHYAPKVQLKDGDTFKLEKNTTEFFITRFYADNPMLHQQHQTTKIYWSCSDPGKKDFVFRLRSVADFTDPGFIWRANDCLGSLDCFDCDTGTSGVETPELDESTIFALDLISSDTGGVKLIRHTLYLTVAVTVPTVDAAYIKKYFSGRIVSLNWSAVNSDRCAVEVDGNRIDDNAPTDTYDAGYFVEISDTTGAHLPTVLPYAHAEPIPGDTKQFDPVGIEPFVTIPLTGISSPNEYLTNLAIAPDGSCVIGGIFQSNVLRVDLRPSHQGSSVIPLVAECIAMGNGGLAVSASNGFWLDRNDYNFGPPGRPHWVTYGFLINASAGTFQALPGITESASHDVAITPDGKFALLTNSAAYGHKNEVTIYDLDNLKIETSIDLSDIPAGVAVTPDGKLALVTTYSAKILVLDLTGGSPSQWTVEPNAIPLEAGQGWSRIVITPDGKRALVADSQANNVSLIDIANRRALSPAIPTSSTPISLAVTPDSKLAIVANTGDSNLMVIRIDEPQAGTLSIPLGPGVHPTAMALSEAANLAVVATDQGTLIQATLMQI
jgi:hypothetical protein